MKYIILTLTLLLASCSDDSNEIESLTKLQRSTQENLQSCQNQLEFYRQGGSNQNTDPTDSYNSQPEKPSEPEYEEVDVYVVDGTKCYASEDQGEAPACGRGFWKCKDGKIRECMTNVKYEIVTEKKLVEE